MLDFVSKIRFDCKKTKDWDPGIDINFRRFYEKTADV